MEELNHILADHTGAAFCLALAIIFGSLLIGFLLRQRRRRKMRRRADD